LCAGSEARRSSWKIFIKDAFKRLGMRNWVREVAVRNRREIVAERTGVLTQRVGVCDRSGRCAHVDGRIFARHSVVLGCVGLMAIAQRGRRTLRHYSRGFFTATSRTILMSQNGCKAFLIKSSSLIVACLRSTRNRSSSVSSVAPQSPYRIGFRQRPANRP